MKKLFRLLVLILAVLIFIAGSKGTTPISIAQTRQTSFWKEYRSPNLPFSFKYPDGELTNFQVSSDKSETKKILKQISASKQNETTSIDTIDSYNVIFSANVVKFDKSLDDFIKEDLPETNGFSQQTILLNGYQGIRISNTGQRTSSYYSYSLFEINGYIYNFALFSDDSELIKGNQPLLDNILATARF